MSLTTLNSKIVYNANGITSFPIPFRFLENSHIRISVDGVVQTLDSDYTLSGADDPSGGEATFSSSTTGEVVIRRIVPLIQETDYTESGPNRAETAERNLDKSVMIAQQQQEEIDRAFKFPEEFTGNVEAESPEANKILIWNNDATKIINGPEFADFVTLEAASSQARDDAQTAQAAAETAQTAAEAALASAIAENAQQDLDNQAAINSAQSIVDAAASGISTDWQASTLYQAGRDVIYQANLYKCLNEHTSTSDFNDNLSDWQLIGDQSALMDSKIATHSALHNAHKEVGTKAELVTWAATAPNGHDAYATDEDLEYIVKNGQLILKNTGAGAGSLGTFFQESFEENGHEVFTTTGSWDKGNDEVTPIKGDRSVVFTQVSGSLGAKQSLSSIALELDQKGTLLGFKGRYQTSLADTYLVRVLESSDNSTFTTLKASTLDKAESVKSFKLAFTPKAASTHLKVELEVLDESIGNTLKIDSLEGEADPLPIVNIDSVKARESFTPTGSYVTNASYSGFKQKIGDGYKYWMKVSFSGATDTGELSFDVPDGTIDIAKLFAESDNRILGKGTFHDSSQPKHYNLRVKYLNDNSVELVYFDDDIPYEETLKFQNSSISTFGTGDELMLEFEVPIEGLSAQDSGVVTEGVEVDQLQEISWTPELKAATTNPTLGVGAIQIATAQRFGSWLIGNVKIRFGTSGTNAGSGNYYIELPNGLEADVTGQAGLFAIGSGYVRNDGTASNNKDILAEVIVANPSRIQFRNYNSTSQTVTSGAPFAWAANDYLEFNFQVKIDGWSAGLSATVISPFKTEITTGQEYKTGEVIDNKDVYAYVFKIASDVTSTATIVSNPVGIVDPVYCSNYFSSFWKIEVISNSSSSENFIYYDRSSGDIVFFQSGTYKLGAGTTLKFQYTK